MAKRRSEPFSLRSSREQIRRAAAADRRHRSGGAARGGAEPLSQLRALGHHVARAARRARRPQAGPAPHPLHDVAAEPDRRRQASQVREGRRRRDGQLSPARRRRALRNARAHGAVVLAALPADRRLRQFRLARRRQRRGDALHRVPPRPHLRRDADRDRAAHGPLPAQLRRHEDRAGRAAGADPEPVHQRRDRHRGRHGDQHPAAQPRRDLHGADQAPRQSRFEQRAVVPLREGPGLSDRRPDAEFPRRAEGDLQDRLGHRAAARDVGRRLRLARRADALRHQHSVHGQQGRARRAHRRRRPVAQAAAAPRRQGRVRPTMCASRWRSRRTPTRRW